MKRMLPIMLSAVLLLVLAACGDNASTDTESSSTIEGSAATGSDPADDPNDAENTRQTEPPAAEHDDGSAETRAVVVYFSWSGNTEKMAAEIQAQTGADRFEITPLEPYPDDYDTLLEIARGERDDNARPAVADRVDLSGYDVIYLGYPIWWADMPMVVYSFLEDCDLSGKTVAPFCTSGSSGISSTDRTIATLQPDAAVLDALHIGSSAAADPADAVAEWLEGLQGPDNE